MASILDYIEGYETGGGVVGQGANVLNCCATGACAGSSACAPSAAGIPQTASGYFQITNQTWGGIPASITQGYPTALAAPYDVQAAGATWLLQNYGTTPWSGNGRLMAALAAAGLTGGSVTPNADPSGNVDFSEIGATAGAQAAQQATGNTTQIPDALGNSAAAMGAVPTTPATGQAVFGSPQAQTGTNAATVWDSIKSFLLTGAVEVAFVIFAFILLAIALWPDKATTIINRIGKAAA